MPVTPASNDWEKAQEVPPRPNGDRLPHLRIGAGESVLEQMACNLSISFLPSLLLWTFHNMCLLS